MKSKLIALVKLARAGGSTYAKNWLNSPDNEGYHRVVVNGDNIRLSLYNQRYCSKGEGFVHATEEVMTRSLLMNDNQKILLDDTHTSISSIRRVLLLDSDAEFIYIDTPMEVCLERARLTNQEDLLKVIPRMFDNLIKLCDYALYRENQHRMYANSSYVGIIFEHPNEEYIHKAVEYIRGDIKCPAQSDQ